MTDGTQGVGRATLHDEGSVVTGILETDVALVLVLDATGQIIRSNRECEQVCGYSVEEMRGKHFWDVFTSPEEDDRQNQIFRDLAATSFKNACESELVTASGDRRRISWSNTLLPGEGADDVWVIATGIDITERKQMEQAILDAGAREQRQLGQELHDGLGQHLTGIAFMSKVLEQKLSSARAAEAAAAAKIVRLVNEAIDKTRELSRGLLPVVSGADGLMSALQRWAADIEDLFQIRCEFICAEPVLIPDLGMATHLFRITQEAVTNALRHADPTRVVITVERNQSAATISIEDDGSGMMGLTADRPGLGLRIMSYRANIIGGSLEVRPGINAGTMVRCQFPIADRGAAV